MNEENSIGMISKDEIKHLGWLARLELSEEEISKYESQIDRIIQHFDILDGLALDYLGTYLLNEVSAQACVSTKQKISVRTFFPNREIERMDI